MQRQLFLWHRRTHVRGPIYGGESVYSPTVLCGNGIDFQISVLRKSNRPLSTLQGFAEHFALLDNPEVVMSSYALDVLADIFAKTKGKREDAVKVYIYIYPF